MASRPYLPLPNLVPAVPASAVDAGSPAYASWALTALPSGEADDDLQLVADAHSAFYRALADREVLLCGTLVWTDPVAVVARMIDALDLTGLDGWAEECEQTIDAVAGLPLGSRLWTLTVPLGVSDWKQKARTLVRSATTELCDQLRIPGHAPGGGGDRLLLPAGCRHPGR